MAALSARRKTLEAQLAAEPEEDPIRLHPAMADTYHTKIEGLITALSRPDEATEAKEKIRGLIDRIVLTPEGHGLQVDLEGTLAAILLLSLGKTNAASGDAASQVMLVAGRRSKRLSGAADGCEALVAGACNQRLSLIAEYDVPLRAKR